MKKLTDKELLKNLCYYDERNPNGGKDEDKPEGDCYCDSCFYGRTRLANELIETRDINKKQHKEIKRLRGVIRTKYKESGKANGTES